MPSNRVARILVSKALLSDILRARGVDPGTEIRSDLPEDAEVVHVLEGGEYHHGAITLIVTSESFDLVPEGAVPPLRQVRFTRKPLEASHA